MSAETLNEQEVVPLTDVGNAQRLVRRYGDRMRFHTKEKHWLKWNGKRWVQDDSMQTEKWAKAIARAFFKQAATAGSRNEQDALIHHARASERAAGIVAMLRMSQSEPGIAVEPAELDSDPWAINLENGILNLRGQSAFRAHEPADLMTKLAPVRFDPTAVCPLWERFLNRVMDNDQEMIGYLRRIAGLWMTGDITRQEFHIFFGAGANGKNVFVDTLADMLGDYSTTAPDKFLTLRTFDAHPTEIADLVGRRLVICSELDSGEELRVGTVKQHTGNPKLKGRFMRKDFFEFDRTHKTLIVTNHKPVIRETKDAIWRRVRLVPWKVQIPESERDLDLKIKLRAEWSGILNWAIVGCTEIQRPEGMRPPDAVLLASKEYRSEQDESAEFFTNCLIVGPGCRLMREAAVEAYNAFATLNHLQNKIVPRELYERIRALDKDSIKDAEWRVPVECGVGSRTTRGFHGVGLKFSE